MPFFICAARITSGGMCASSAVGRPKRMTRTTAAMLPRWRNRFTRKRPVPVSYTHLDVYKRQADDIATRLFTDIADLTMAAGKAAGLDHYNIVSVNNSMSAEWGNFCAASACGRKAGSPMANANGASIGADKCGITALLNSMSKFDNTKHVGVINNVRFTKELFKGSMDKVEAVLKAFYDNDGVQTNLCVIGKDDLENAMVCLLYTSRCV